MQNDTLNLIEEQLQRLPADKLETVLDFVTYLTERLRSSESFQTMVASEQVLGKDWESPEEDNAWAHL